MLIIGLHYSPEETGNAPYTASLAEGLRRRGFQVRVITGHPHYPAWEIAPGYGQWKSTEVINGVSVLRLRHYVPKSPNGWRRLVSELSFGFRTIASRWGRPDVVLVVSPALFATALAATKAKLRFHRVPLAVWVQDLYGLGVSETGKGGGATEAFVSLVEKLTLKSADGVAVIHGRFRKHVTENLGIRPSAVEVIRNWSHVRGSFVGDRSIRETLGWRPREIVALHAGNMGTKQGLDNVVAAARIADERTENVRFVLLGDGNQRRRLRASAEGIERLQFLDPLPGDSFERALAAADVLLVNELPGVTEMSVPSKLTSYFSAGRPVIAATDFGSVTHGEIESSGGGTRVASTDPSALVDEALRLGNDPHLSAALGEAGLRYRSDVLGEDAAVDHYAGWLRSLAENRVRTVGARLPDTQGGNA